MKMYAVFLLFNLGGGEIFLILVASIMLFGSKRIPEIARTIGKGMREVRNATNDIKREIQKGVNEAESYVQKATEEAEKSAEEVNETLGSVSRKKPERPIENSGEQMNEMDNSKSEEKS